MSEGPRAAELAGVLVYDVGGTHYVANFGEGGWFKWPAKKDGWREHVRSTDPGDDAIELPPFNAALALMLSGVDEP
jgi:hypothetical protein